MSWSSPLRRAHWERQLAEAHYGLGELSKSRDRLKQAIHILGWKTPEKGLGLVTSLLGQVLKQVRFRMNPKPIVEGQLPSYLQDTAQAKIIEGGMSFVRLGHIYYQMNLTFPLIFSVLNALKSPEESGLKSPSLVRSYASMCVVSGLLPRHDWAIAYRDRSHETGRVVNDFPALSYALSGCAIYELGAALWEAASKSLNEAIEIDGRIGDVRHYDESKTIFRSYSTIRVNISRVLKSLPKFWNVPRNARMSSRKSGHIRCGRRCFCEDRNQVHSRGRSRRTKNHSNCWNRALIWQASSAPPGRLHLPIGGITTWFALWNAQLPPLN